MIDLFDNWLLIMLKGMKSVGWLFFSFIISIPIITQAGIEKRTIEFYAALNKGDSIDVVRFFHPESHIKHVGKSDVWDLPLDEFLGVCPKFKSDHFSEEITKLQVHEFGLGLTYVDVYFDFYVDGTYSHSGLDHFCWTYHKGELKIESVYSSDFEEQPKLPETAQEMTIILEKWHNDVAIFDYDSYFNFMSNEFIFLGTDPEERWTKDQFSAYCKPYFARKSTWDFKTNWRNWYFSEDHKVAWFEESLETKMDECRGSGVLIKTNEGWKIAHYNLTVLIENEKMKKFLKLRRK